MTEQQSLSAAARYLYKSIRKHPEDKTQTYVRWFANRNELNELIDAGILLKGDFQEPDAEVPGAFTQFPIVFNSDRDCREGLPDPEKEVGLF